MTHTKVTTEKKIYILQVLENPHKYRLHLLKSSAPPDNTPKECGGILLGFEMF